MGAAKRQYGTHFIQFLTQVAWKYDFNHIGIECTDDKIGKFAKKLNFYSKTGTYKG